MKKLNLKAFLSKIGLAVFVVPTSLAMSKSSPETSENYNKEVVLFKLEDEDVFDTMLAACTECGLIG